MMSTPACSGYLLPAPSSSEFRVGQSCFLDDDDAIIGGGGRSRICVQREAVCCRFCNVVVNGEGPACAGPSAASDGGTIERALCAAARRAAVAALVARARADHDRSAGRARRCVFLVLDRRKRGRLRSAAGAATFAKATVAREASACICLRI